MLFFIHNYIFYSYIIIIVLLFINNYVIVINILINYLVGFINYILFVDIIVNGDVNHYFVIVSFIFALLDLNNIDYYFYN
jgi:hypothetical protein